MVRRVLKELRRLLEHVIVGWGGGLVLSAERLLDVVFGGLVADGWMRRGRRGVALGRRLVIALGLRIELIVVKRLRRARRGLGLVVASRGVVLDGVRGKFVLVAPARVLVGRRFVLVRGLVLVSRFVLLA